METALLSDLMEVVASTDDEEMLWNLGKKYEGISRFRTHVRPPVPDNQSSEEGLCLAMGEIGEREHAALLQATSPGLRVNDINKALGEYDGKNTILTAWKFWGMIGECGEKQTTILFNPIIPKTTEPRRRQERPPVLVEAGSLYIAPMSAWKSGNRMVGEPRAVVVNQWRAVEIDDISDFKTWRRCYDLWESETP